MSIGIVANIFDSLKMAQNSFTPGPHQGFSPDPHWGCEEKLEIIPYKDAFEYWIYLYTCFIF